MFFHVVLVFWFSTRIKMNFVSICKCLCLYLCILYSDLAWYSSTHIKIAKLKEDYDILQLIIALLS